jgi:hypothetical protein
MSANDVRELENMNPLEGEEGDIYLSPANMMKADQVGQQPESTPAEKTPPEADQDRSFNSIESAIKSIVSDGLMRVIRKESTVLQKASKKPRDEGRKIMDRFYADHAEYIQGVLNPIIDAAAQLYKSIGKEINLDARAISLCHVDDRRSRIDELLTHPDENVETAAQDMFHRITGNGKHTHEN